MGVAPGFDDFEILATVGFGTGNFTTGFLPVFTDGTGVAGTLTTGASGDALAAIVPVCGGEGDRRALPLPAVFESLRPSRIPSRISTMAAQAVKIC